MSSSRGGDRFAEQNPDVKRSLEDNLAVQGSEEGPVEGTPGGATAAEGTEEGLAALRESGGDAFPARDAAQEETTRPLPGTDTSSQPS